MTAPGVRPTAPPVGDPAPAPGRRHPAVRHRPARSLLVGAILLVVLAGCGTAGATERPTGTTTTIPAPPPAAALVAPAAADGGTPLARGWTPPAGMPTTGAVTTAAIPGIVSGFEAADAWIYLPPAYGSIPRGELPTLVLMAGNPGEPQDWFDGGGVAATMDAYAADHGGLAPVVVVPDWFGTSGENPLCVDSAVGGNDFTYLTVDVRDWIIDQLGVDPDPQRWAVGGLSAGGTCALQIAVREPAQFPTVLAFSTQDHPVLEDGEDTLATLFDDDEDAYDAIDPMAVFDTTTFPASAGLFAAGEDDDVYGPQTRAVYDAAEAAGMNAQYTTFPGGHDFGVWSSALVWATPWLGSRLGIAP